MRRVAVTEPHPEIVDAVSLTATAGGPNQAALGWARRALHTCEIDGSRGRRKRWHFWGVTSPELVLSMTIVDLDYVHAGIVAVLDPKTGREVRAVRARPLGVAGAMPSRPNAGDVRIEGRGFCLAFEDRTDQIAMTVRTPRIVANIIATRPADRDALGVALSWDSERFAYTYKEPALRARGTVRVDGETIGLGEPSFAVQDYGRGVWPARTRWNWCTATSTSDERTIALNLGAQWTDGCGVNENALFVDGRMTKISSDVRFHFDPRAPDRPWSICGPDVELTLSPAVVQRSPRAAGLVGDLVVAFGHLEGRVLSESISGAFGWAEELRIVW